MGASLRVVCPYCRTMNEPDAGVCRNCSAPVDASQAAPMPLQIAAKPRKSMTAGRVLLYIILGCVLLGGLVAGGFMLIPRTTSASGPAKLFLGVSKATNVGTVTKGAVIVTFIVSDAKGQSMKVGGKARISLSQMSGGYEYILYSKTVDVTTERYSTFPNNGDPYTAWGMFVNLPDPETTALERMNRIPFAGVPIAVTVVFWPDQGGSLTDSASVDY